MNDDVVMLTRSLGHAPVSELLRALITDAPLSKSEKRRVAHLLLAFVRAAATGQPPAPGWDLPALTARRAL